MIGHFTYFVAIFLMVAGLFIVIARSNLIKKLIGLSIFQTSVYILYIAPVLLLILRLTQGFAIGGEWHPYTKIIEAPNETQARERAFTIFGSKHRLKRRYITVSSITALNGE